MSAEPNNSIPGLKELQTQRARMAFEVGWNTHRLIVIFYHLDGESEPYTFTRLDTVQPLSDQPDSVWVKGEDAMYGLINQAIHRITSISAEPVLVPSKMAGRKV